MKPINLKYADDTDLKAGKTMTLYTTIVIVCEESRLFVKINK